MQTIDLITGLSAIAGDYDGIISDVWGVLHNGADPHPDAPAALEAARAAGLRVVLITNAPRRSSTVMTEMLAYGITDKTTDAMVTSGDVCRGLLANEPRRRAVHIGLAINLEVFTGIDVELVPDSEAEFVICTAPDAENNQPEYYRARLEALVRRGLRFYCFNPDVVVEQGDRLVYCAGALAALYEELGGEVIYGGKPYKPIYEAALAALSEAAGHPIERRRVLAIGDGLPTDIRGAAAEGIDVLMVTSGIHAADFGDVDHPDARLIARRLDDEGITVRAAIPHLAW